MCPPVVQPKREVHSDLLDRISVCFYWIKGLAHTLKSKVEWRATSTPAVHYYQITPNFISEVVRLTRSYASKSVGTHKAPSTCPFLPEWFYDFLELVHENPPRLSEIPLHREIKSSTSYCTKILPCPGQKNLFLLNKTENHLKSNSRKLAKPV